MTAMLFRDLIPAIGNRPLRERRRGDPFHAMRREMNRMFDEMWPDFDLPLLGRGDGGFEPRVDVSETEKEVLVTAELPGMEEKDVNVTFADGMLTIEGAHAEETEKKDEDKRYYLRECAYGAFKRVLPLGTGLDAEKIKATFKNGELKVVLPKTKEAKEKTKRIPITH